VGLAAFVLVAGIAVGYTTKGGSSAEAAALARSTSASRPGQVPLAKLVGQTVMGRVDGTVASADFLARVRRGEVGGVILFGNSFTSLAGLRALVASLQRAAKQGGNPPLLIATDQEGGIVKRLPNGPPTRSARELGAQGAAAARDEGAATGRYLRSLGIDVDLAPVLDVPSSPSNFLGSRAFGSDPATVARVGGAFARGLQSARVAATAKHFPGLGTAGANTDLGQVTIGSTKANLTRRLAPFRTAVRDGTKLVMVSNAAYPALDHARLPASISPGIVAKLLRGRLGFRGVVVTDAISAPGPAAYRDAAVRAVKAGVDIVLFTDNEAQAAAGFRSVLEAARRGQLGRAKLRQAYDRVLALKAWLGEPGKARAKRQAKARQLQTAAANRVLAKVHVVTGSISPKSVVASGNGLFFAQNMMYRHTITVYDRRFQLVKTIDDAVDLAKLGAPGFPGTYKGAPVEAAFSPDGAYAYVSNYSMYGPKLTREGHDVCSPSSGYDRSFLYRVDVAHLRIDRAIPVGSVPKFVAVTPDGRYALVSNWCSYSLSVVSTKLGRQVREIPLGPYPRGIAVSPDSREVYVAVMGSTHLARIDLTTFKVRWIDGVGIGPRHLVVGPSGNFLYATLNGEGRVAKINLHTGEVIAKVATGSQPRSMAISDDGLFLYVVNYESNTVSKVRTRDMAVVQTVSTGSHPIGITYDAATRQVWVACYSGAVEVFIDA
jgi:YVTN family beta-propeller protein